MKTSPLIQRVLCAVVAFIACCHSAHAQWQTQTITLKPGWNAVYLHVDASHVLLDDLVVGAGNPIAEIWAWTPPASTVQFVTSPAEPSLSTTQWKVWDRSIAVSDTLMRLSANTAYLVNNNSSADFVWSLKGRPVAPRYSWTTSGLNFIGFATPGAAAPDFDTFLAPLPEFKANFQANLPSAGIYRYPGGPLGANNPVRIISQLFRTTPVKRGEAFWINAPANVYNRYFGPFEVSLQNPAGINFGDNLGTYQVRLKNTSATNRTVTVTMSLLASEAPPAGQPTITATPPLLLRGPYNPTTLTFGHVALSTPQTFTLAGAGADGSEVELVIGLNRSAMTGAVGSLFAGMLRFTDAGGLEQVDVPVSATIGDTSGLWVGSASVSSVNHYLKDYADASNPASIPPTDAAGFALDSLPGRTWTLQNSPAGTFNWRAVASSGNGSNLVAAVNVGNIYTSSDGGVTWTSRPNAGVRAWTSVAASSSGTNLVATVNGGQIFTSTDGGVTWSARASNRAWTDVASSADGQKLVAVAYNDNIFTSVNGGTNWTARAASGVRAWTTTASSADGQKLVAAALGSFLYTSEDAGTNWTVRASMGTNIWSGLASSADGNRIVASASGTNLLTSVDAGTNWTYQLGSPVVAWSAVAASQDGTKLVGVVTNGLIYTSTDAGTNWTGRDSVRNWTAAAASADGTKLVATVNAGRIHTSSGTFVSIEADAASGRIIARSDTGAPYVAIATNLSPGAVARPYPLRLILHNNAPGNNVSLLQRVYFGQKNSTTQVVTTRESVLDPANLSTARRISASHLPFSHANTFWPKSSGTMNLGGTLAFNLNLDYNDHAANPFLHTYHPDHDNLKSDFKTVEVQGAESYTVNRLITLAFTPPASDFTSLTAGPDSVGGVYSEVITFYGRAGNSRQFTVSGSFLLNRISSIATLTTQ